MRPAGDKGLLLLRRTETRKLLNGGVSPEAAAKIMGVSVRTVWRWKDARRFWWKAVPKPIRRPGRPGGLSYADTRRFLAVLQAGPKYSGFMPGTWKTRDLLAILRASFATPWGQRSLTTFLLAWGWKPLGGGISWEKPGKGW